MEKSQQNRPVSIAIGTRDYQSSFGGTEKVIATHQLIYNKENWDYLYLFAITPRIKGKTIGNYWGCRLNGNFVGAFSNIGIIKYIGGTFRARIRTICIHHLRLLHIPSVKLLLESLPNNKIWIYLHDYYLVCDNYNLLWNDQIYCELGKKKDTPCISCEFKDHSKQNEIMRLLNKIFDRVFFVAPSEVAKSIFVQRNPEFVDKVIVLPHQKFKGKYRGNLESLDKNQKIRIAFCGAPASNKGWDDWVRLLNEIKDFSEYEFYHLGVKAQNEPEKSKHVDVVFNQKSLNAMISALREHNIDVVFLWSNWPETYSYVYYECFAANVFVITRDDSGNMAYMTRTIHNGLVLQSYDDALALFSNSEKLRNILNNFKRKHIYGPDEVIDNDDIISLADDHINGDVLEECRIKLVDDMKAKILSIIYKKKIKVCKL